MKYQEFSKRPNVDEGCALFYKEMGDSKYHILLPLETIPTMQGEREELEYTYTTMAVVGKVQGRMSTETSSTDFYWHRDIVNKLKSLKGKQLELLVVLPSYQGYKARGEVSYAYNDINTGELVTGTITITPSWIDETHIDDVSDLIMETALIESAIDTDVEVSKTTPKVIENISTYPSTATCVLAYYTDDEYKVGGTSTIATGNVTGSDKKTLTITANSSAEVGSTEIIEIATNNEGYATDKTYIRVTIVG